MAESVCCSVLQCVIHVSVSIVKCGALCSSVDTRDMTLQHGILEHIHSPACETLQHTVFVLQCVAMRCSVLQCLQECGASVCCSAAAFALQYSILKHIHRPECEAIYYIYMYTYVYIHT